MDRILIKTRKKNEVLKEIFKNTKNSYLNDLYENGVAYPASYQISQTIQNLLKDYNVKFLIK